MGSKKTTGIISVDELLKMNLTIPNYQRPYQWANKSVTTLLNDIEKAYYDNFKGNGAKKYRLGSIILYENNNHCEIVDGQQRIITLFLIKKIIDSNFDSSFLKNEQLSSKKTIVKIKENYDLIKIWINNKKDLKNILKKSFKDILEVLIIKVDSLDEAFQMFDSQNTRGKSLSPHDLLKAFHLREITEMNNYDMTKKEIKKTVGNYVASWENRKSAEINSLFSNYLFPILNWINMNDYKKFESSDIDNYKGITLEIRKFEYNYAKVSKNHFEIGIPFYSGNHFFDFVNSYFKKMDSINLWLKENNRLAYDIFSFFLNKEVNLEKFPKDYFKFNSKVQDIIDQDNVIGTKYLIRLFYCTILYYYDRFNKMDNVFVNKMFKWVLSLRLDLEMVNMTSINKYARGETNDKYKNNLPIFLIIRNSLYHTDLFNINVEVREIDPNNKWANIYSLLDIIDGKEEYYYEK